MVSFATGLVVLATVLAIFATTATGRRLVAKVGLRGPVAGGAPGEDVEFLLRRCRGDVAEVARRVAAERERFPALTEADHYRRAIRRLLAESPADLSSTDSTAASSGSPRRP